jgi:hypothetical protein
MEDGNTDDRTEILPSLTRDEKIIETVGTVSALVPVLGGPLSSILLGISGDRRFERVRGVLFDLADRLGDLADEQADFIRSADFEDLLIETLQRVAAERSERKRRSYRNLVLHAIADGNRNYDETLRFERVLERLQPIHLDMLDALAELPVAESAPPVDAMTLPTLAELFPYVPYAELIDLAQQLADERVIALSRLSTGALPVEGPRDLRAQITLFGQRFWKYVVEEV